MFLADLRLSGVRSDAPCRIADRDQKDRDQKDRGQKDRGQFAGHPASGEKLRFLTEQSWRRELPRTVWRVTQPPRCYDHRAVYTLCCTQNLRDRLNVDAAAPTATATTALGNWYTTPLFWKPQLALLVSERALLPVLMPLAPVSTLALRFPAELARVLTAIGMPADFIERELAEMTPFVIAKTANRSIVGMINEFAFMAGVHREDAAGLIALALRLSDIPCGPLRGNSPARRVREMISFGATGTAHGDSPIVP